MPELPEVETVCRGLRQSVLGRSIEQVELRRSHIRVPIPEDLAERLEGFTILRVERCAKYVLIHMDSGYVMIVHLGMSGRLMVLSTLPETFAKHDHAAFILSDGQVILFNDPRRFGVITGCDAQDLPTHPMLAGLGPEPLSDDFDGAYLYGLCSTRKQPIKPLLMDQKWVVGVGNIYASESLFSSHILPERPANKITKKEANLLVESIKATLMSAIDSGGSTLRDYVDSRGEAGYFQHRFFVYDKEGEPCAVCARPISRIVQAGRATYFCRKCQK